MPNTVLFTVRSAFSVCSVIANCGGNAVELATWCGHSATWSWDPELLACEAEDEASYAPVPADGWLEIEFDRDLRGCTVTITRLPSETDGAAFEVEVCNDFDDDTCAAGRWSATGVETQFDVPCELR